jgi:hypothetical protein
MRLFISYIWIVERNLPIPLGVKMEQIYLIDLWINVDKRLRFQKKMEIYKLINILLLYTGYQGAFSTGYQPIIHTKIQKLKRRLPAPKG